MAGKSKEMGAVSLRVAANVRRLRYERDLTTAALARRLTVIGWPIADTGITKIEKGGRRVDVDDAVALAQALGVSVGDLLTTDFALMPVGTAATVHFTAAGG